MILLYWVLALGISAVMGTVTAVAIAFVLGFTLTRGLTPETRRFWNGFVAFITYATYLVVALSNEPSAISGGEINGWTDLWKALDHLLQIELSWCFRLIGFWIVITIVIILVPYRRM
jgi:hypothetical protein